MSPHITVVPASTNVGRETIRVLLGSGRKLFIRGIYRDPSKALVEYTQNPNFEAAKGDVGDSASLDFSDSNAVFYIPPPTYDGTDTSEWAAKSAANVKDAIRRAPTVKKLILHSAVGAHHNHGIVSQAVDALTRGHALTRG